MDCLQSSGTTVQLNEVEGVHPRLLERGSSKHFITMLQPHKIQICHGRSFGNTVIIFVSPSNGIRGSVILCWMSPKGVSNKVPLWECLPTLQPLAVHCVKCISRYHSDMASPHAVMPCPAPLREYTPWADMQEVPDPALAGCARTQSTVVIVCSLTLVGIPLNGRSCLHTLWNVEFSRCRHHLIGDTFSSLIQYTYAQLQRRTQKNVTQGVCFLYQKRWFHFL